MAGNPHGLRVAVDIGGTFTDLAIFDPATGRLEEIKTSTTPGDLAEGVFTTLEESGVEAESVASLIHGSTVVINAISQRRGVATALVTTAGFRDVLEISRGNRPDMYNLRYRKPVPFVPRRRRYEVSERILADGRVAAPLRTAELDAVIQACRAEKVGGVAVCFLHAFTNPAHEQEAAAYLRQHLPGVSVCASSDIAREWREYERTNTTVLNAYVQPIVDRYLSRLQGGLEERGYSATCFAMQSNGGTASFDHARRQAIQFVESGPAGGVAGAAAIGGAIGERNLITLDIGGTTAKCSLINDGEIKPAEDYRLEQTPDCPGYPVRIPVIDIVEIGAGGGSIAWMDEGGALRVGPISAGAVPGPACYGRGGTQPTVTDAMLLTGVLDPDQVLGGRILVDPDLARRSFSLLSRQFGVSIDELAVGVIRLVNDLTSSALKLISLHRGHDPRDFSLVAFGGGGPMHAAALGEELGVKQIVIPPMPGIFSSWGMLMTQPRIDLVQTHVCPIDDSTVAEIIAVLNALTADAERQFAAQGLDDRSRLQHRCFLDLRYVGQEHTVRVAVRDTAKIDVAEIERAFHEQHRRQYTFAIPHAGIELVNIRTISTADWPRPPVGQRKPSGSAPEPMLHRDVDFGPELGPAGVRVSTPVYFRETLPAGWSMTGPAVIEEASATTLLLPGQRLHVDPISNLIIEPTR